MVAFCVCHKNSNSLGQMIMKSPEAAELGSRADQLGALALSWSGQSRM
jgi:hypothetical protein